MKKGGKVYIKELFHPEPTSLIPEVTPEEKDVQRSKGKDLTEVAFCSRMPSFYKIPYHFNNV